MRSMFLASVSIVAALAVAQPVFAQSTPMAGAAQTSPPSNAWPTLPQAAPDAPSVLLIMTDDVGFGASSTFGGPIDTPTFDALARDGCAMPT